MPPLCNTTKLHKHTLVLPSHFQLHRAKDRNKIAFRPGTEPRCRIFQKQYHSKIINMLSVPPTYVESGPDIIARDPRQDCVLRSPTMERTAAIPPHTNLHTGPEQDHFSTFQVPANAFEVAIGQSTPLARVHVCGYPPFHRSLRGTTRTERSNYLSLSWMNCYRMNCVSGRSAISRMQMPQKFGDIAALRVTCHLFA